MSDADRKIARVLYDALEAIEDYSGGYGHANAEHRLMLVQLLAGLCMATVLERAGLWRMLRTLFGAVFIAVRHRGLVEP